MALVFCCPVCGQTLRASRSEGVPVIACPGCGEPLRIPRQAYPEESAHDLPSVRSQDALQAQRGLKRLASSVWVFCAASFAALIVLSLWVAIGTRPAFAPPGWLSPLVNGLVFTWLALSWLGCGLRIRGYYACERAAASVGVDGWIRLAAWGSSLVAVGQFSAVVLLFTRNPKWLPPDLLPIAMVGLLCGVIGTAMEFGFLTATHRLLWETAGWQVANRTGHFAITFIFSVVASMCVICVGFLSLSSLQNRHPAGLQSSEARVILAGMLSGLAALLVLVSLRYLRLLATARQALRPLPASSPLPSLPIPENGESSNNS
jgi:hypothetical protein